jgi:polysaccharide pyruvyl transferase WcaK-like protein
MSRPDSTLNRLLIIADLGNERARHIGDEAMFEANVEALRALFPGVAFTAIARDPDWVSQRYAVDAVTIDAMDDAVASSDAVIVSGGGNLSSTWPELLHERIALLELARHHEKPAVVLGQTIGPHLTSEQRESLASALSYARFVGVREVPTALLAVELGVPPQRLWYQCDDATFFDDVAPEKTDTPTVAVTIDPQLRANGEALFDALAEQLRELSKRTGAALLLVPHAFGDFPSDLIEARLLAEKLGGVRVTIAESLDARATRRLTAGASLVISSRYHPIVFGLAAGVACIGIYGDDYCRIKLQGALAHAHREEWALTYDDVARGALLRKSLELWNAPADLAAHIESWRAEGAERWRAVRAALERREPARNEASLFGRPRGEVGRRIAAAHSAQRRWSESRARGTRRGYVATLRRWLTR